TRAEAKNLYISKPFQHELRQRSVFSSTLHVFTMESESTLPSDMSRPTNVNVRTEKQRDSLDSLCPIY
ncbi:hypothetical protein, partial [Aneurinibacillus aneurinilyticus]|uniref:hypothetical protein n=1 Tax=Aneurinibacillus aneurinilyticus TaxID=1391 RepID=UPI003FA4D00A